MQAARPQAQTLAPRGFCTEAIRPLIPQLQRDLHRFRSITPQLLDEARGLLPDGPVRAALAIVNRTVWWLRPTGRPRSPMLISLVHDLQELADAHELPDLEIVVNVDDYPFVPRPAPSPVRSPPPLFSFYQTARHADLLCPSSSFREASFERVAAVYERRARSTPWEARRQVGFWQGHPYCGKHKFGRCSRYLLSHLSAQSASPLLDVGLTWYEPRLDLYLRQEASASAAGGVPCSASDPARRPWLQEECRCAAGWAHPGDLPRRAAPLAVRPWVQIEDHTRWAPPAGAVATEGVLLLLLLLLEPRPSRRALLCRYRYLLQLDGHTASWRFQFLLASHSLVLKQWSYYREYYYAGLEPGVHYLPFWTRSAADVIEVLENATREDASLRELPVAASRFTRDHLNPYARQCYWRALLGAYAERLAEPGVRLSRWPAAAQVRRDGSSEGWYPRADRRGGTLLDWARAEAAWRSADDAVMRRVVRSLRRPAVASERVEPATVGLARRDGKGSKRPRRPRRLASASNVHLLRV